MKKEWTSLMIPPDLKRELKRMKHLNFMDTYEQLLRVMIKNTTLRKDGGVN